MDELFYIMLYIYFKCIHQSITLNNKNCGKSQLFFYYILYFTENVNFILHFFSLFSCYKYIRKL